MQKSLSNNTKVMDALKEFETIENIETTDDWNRSLMERLASVKPRSASPFTSTKMLVAIVFVVTLNIYFLLNALVIHPGYSAHRNNDLKVISRELLINPISIKN
jgi:hypothetical protein